MNEIQQQPQQQVIYTQPQTSGLAVASLIFGLISILGGCGLLLPQIVAVILGHIAVGSCKRDPKIGGKGMAYAGLIMGWICIIVPIILIAIVFLFLGGLAAFAPAAVEALESSGTLSDPSY